MDTGSGRNRGGFEPEEDPAAWRAPASGGPESAPTEAIPYTPGGVPNGAASQATPWSRPEPAFGGTDAPTTAFGWVGQAPGPEPAPAPNFPPQQQFPSPLGSEPGWQPQQAGPQAHSFWNPEQQPPTAQFPSPQPPAGPPPKRRKALLLSGIGVLAVIAVGVTVAIVTSGNSGDATAAKSGTPSMVSALSTENQPPPPQSPPAAPPSHPAPKPRPGQAPPPGEAPPPTIPGYQVVQILDRGAAYDAPADWKPAEVPTAVWGSGSDTLEVAGLTQDGKNYCPNYTRTNAFLTMSQQADPAVAAADVGKRIGAFGWTGAKITNSSAAEQMVSADGQLHGMFVETTGSAPAPSPGCATTFSVYTFAFPSENGNFVMTVAADTGVDHAVDQATAKRILSTIRPLPAR
ncbi:hypothetical protein NONO_c03630 [Nocardia nova SH22a]|uniref:DUF8017 domain-containing protein n=1 Tax=Nocardia nova SH22a TaxID=1415166 RepID=W5T7J9_9NOCA|nr:hypothetical protein [Nocardia nova]AHH15177.1 hypothetical protein NONO_c03630 [Nocardia nova SH22a]